MFGPPRKSETIKLANINFYTAYSNSSSYDNVSIIPGLTANGQPTNNASLTIDKSLIKVTDDWDYIITINNVI